ncbi:MAG TPA: cation diffusion facilitator family transporter [Kouleothrix sp.]|nr:cation diffusion facilitator family transporter [Kouleothrix sp.]HRC77387.1 cation diffusion facilitator family transporter [Kouleothrix sp.]
MTNVPVADAALPARRYAFLSLGAAAATIALKLAAYWLTDSVGLLSDALESIVNLVAALVAIWALTLASRPPDDEHAYGHSKAEYFSSGAESVMILLAAGGIALTAINRLQNPRPIENVWVGLLVSVVAAGINGAVALTLLRASRRLSSITLRADAHHLLTDVWTSGGVVLGVVLVNLTGWLPLDPLIAIAVAANIVWAGWRLLRETADGLLDIGWPAEQRRQVEQLLEPYRKQGLQFHAIRTRIAGQRRFLSFHVLVPGEWSVQRGHALCEELELRIRAELARTTVFTHLEPLEDASSWDDQTLDRVAMVRD